MVSNASGVPALVQGPALYFIGETIAEKTGYDIMGMEPDKQL